MSPIQGEIPYRKHDPREMLLLSGGRLFQDVGYVRASIYRIASAVNAPKGTFYNYFKSKEELALRLVDRQIEALRESLSRSGRVARVGWFGWLTLSTGRSYHSGILRGSRAEGAPGSVFEPGSWVCFCLAL